MSKENYLNKIKDLPESLRQFIGLIIITLIVIISFSILNGIFGQGDDLVKRMKLIYVYLSIVPGIDVFENSN